MYRSVYERTKFMSFDFTSLEFDTHTYLLRTIFHKFTLVTRDKGQEKDEKKIRKEMSRRDDVVDVV